jgi:hypothetical protein
LSPRRGAIVLGDERHAERAHDAVAQELDDSAAVRLAIRVHAELATDLHAKVLAVLFNDHGRVELDRIAGTAADGVSFENLFLGVMVTDGVVIGYCELFGAMERAGARPLRRALCR